jgi:hypothetical protein
MAKRALCVGINDYPLADMDLKGCVNDAHDWAKVLTEHYDFARSDVTLLLDADATKTAIRQQLGTLLAGAAKGDVLVFTNSSHGTYVGDTSGDEPSYDEAICPYDTTDELLVDDELRELFSGLKPGVRLTVISDSCFSGTVTRAAELPPTPDDRRRRFLNPKLIGLPEIPEVRAKAKPRSEQFPQSQMKEVLLSGCSDKQYSYDALINGRYNGAMTATAMGVLARNGYDLTYSRLAKELVQDLKTSNYDQEPQLEGRLGLRRRRAFT